jgi:hypothetical protein
MLASIDAQAEASALPANLPEDRANATELAALARDVLVRELVPALDEDLRLKGLMVANAMGIVARSLSSEATAVDCRDLVARIRDGSHDADRGLHGALRDEAKRRTRVVNPKYAF